MHDWHPVLKDVLRVIILLLCVWGSPTAKAVSFMGLGDLPGGLVRSGIRNTRVANAPVLISRDGSVVAGISSSERGFEAFRWTLASGMEGLGSLPPEANQIFDSEPEAISGDGSIIVGHSKRANAGSRIGAEPFRWTSNTGMVGLGIWPGAGSSEPAGVSDDGSTIVGHNCCGGFDPITWHWSEGPGYKTFDHPLRSGSAQGVSGDGSVIVGTVRIFSRLVRWTEETGVLELWDGPGHSNSINVEDMNADASVIVGSVSFDGCCEEQPFRWTDESDVVLLDGWDALRFGSVTYAAVSEDGSTIVGGQHRDPRFPPFIWDDANGVRDLHEVLVSEYGLGDELADWTGLIATDISGDGQRIVGRGTNPQGEYEAWIAILEPSLQPGDADQDLDFDQMDLVQVQVAAKYLTSQAATWGEGDWDGAPGGEPGNPPAGNGLFDQLDIVAALGAGAYLTGPYAAMQAGGTLGDGQTSVIYNSGTGELMVDTPAGIELTSINIDSAAGIFTGEAAQSLGGSFDNDADNNIFKATFGGSFGSLSFGIVAQAGLSQEFVLGDLSVVGSLAAGGDLGDVDLVYVPEPTSLLLLALGLTFGRLHFRRVDR